MMGKVILWVGLVLVMGLSVVRADEENTPKPGTADDNECYTGGRMAGKCDNGFHADGSVTPEELEWAWRCGWYMARFNDGVIVRGEVPSDCGILLLGLEKAVEGGNCWTNGSVSILYVGPANKKGNAKGYLTPNCTGPEQPNPGGNGFVVFANNSGEAGVLCAAQGIVVIIIQLNSFGLVNAPANAWGCVVSV